MVTDTYFTSNTFGLQEQAIKCVILQLLIYLNTKGKFWDFR